MTYPHKCENIKVCPGCGTNLGVTSRHCAVCGYTFDDADLPPVELGARAKENRAQKPFAPRAQNRLQVTLSLPALLGILLMLVSINALVILGLQKRGQTRTQFAADKATATYLATTYLSPTPTITITPTPAPPTATPVVDIEYEVVSGDSCLSISQKFNIDLNTLVRKNDIDCSLLNIGTVLKIPQPTPTPALTSTPAEPPAQ